MGRSSWKICEFAYEQHNRTLQKIKTNGHIWELDFTMLCQICHHGHLTACIQDCMILGNPLSKALQVLVPQTCIDLEGPATMSPLSEAQHNGQGKNLSIEVYELILA